MTLARLFDKLRGNGRYATADDIRNVFGDYHNVLHWLADFLLGDSNFAESCIVDACTIAQTQGPMFHEWLVYWAARATVRCAFQTQQASVLELAREYEQGVDVEQKQSPVSVEHFQLLIENSDLIQARLDVLCRFVLVYRGIAKDSTTAVASQLGITASAVERAYENAINALDLLRQGAVRELMLPHYGHIYHESALAASID